MRRTTVWRCHCYSRAAAALARDGAREAHLQSALRRTHGARQAAARRSVAATSLNSIRSSPGAAEGVGGAEVHAPDKHV